MEQVNRIPIEKLVPHRHPMVLVERMLEFRETESVCETTIRPDSLFLEKRGLPAFVGLEIMAQSVAAHGGYRAYRNGEPVRIGFLLGTPRFTTHRAYFPMGSTLRIEVKQTWGDDQMMSFYCEIRDGLTAELLQATNLNVFQPNDLDTYLGRSSST